MLYNNIVFLSDNLELSCEKPQNLLAEVKYNGSENFGCKYQLKNAPHTN